MSVMERPIQETPVAVLDFETTGLSPKTGSRVVEIGVVRVDPGAEPRVVLDTLVDPEGPVHATDIHGITDEDVVGAPTFRELAGHLFDVLDGAVVLAYNSAFDMAFLRAELIRASKLADLDLPPHLCLMWLRPLLGLGARASLCATCEHFGLPKAVHTAADDAIVSAYLWLRYREHALQSGLRTFADISRLGTHKYLKTLTQSPYQRTSGIAVLTVTATVSFKARAGRVAFKPTIAPVTSTGVVTPPSGFSEYLLSLNQHFGEPPLAARRRAYWHALIDTLMDHRLSDEDIGLLRTERRSLDLQEADIRALHSRYVGQRMLQMVEDHTIDMHESGELKALFTGMRQLGWVPGE